MFERALFLTLILDSCFSGEVCLCICPAMSDLDSVFLTTSTPKLKNGLEGAVRIPGVYFNVETPSQLVLREWPNSLWTMLAFIPFSQVEYKMGGETTPYR